MGKLSVKWGFPFRRFRSIVLLQKTTGGTGYEKTWNAGHGNHTHHGLQRHAVQHGGSGAAVAGNREKYPEMGHIDKCRGQPCRKAPDHTAPAAEAPQKTLELVEEPAPQPPAPTPEQDKTLQESIDHHEQVTLPQTEQPVESPVMIDWPYPPITCPSKPDPTPATNWPYITAPEPPTYTPEPKPTEPPQEEPAPTPIPDVPADPVPEPTEQPTEQPAEPSPDPTAEPQTGYAACSCGARLSHEELVPHMKAHALKVENHSYRAY